jgi:hypothetical protein
MADGKFPLPFLPAHVVGYLVSSILLIVLHFLLLRPRYHHYDALWKEKFSFVGSSKLALESARTPTEPTFVTKDFVQR